MSTITITGKSVSVKAIKHKWDGAVLACFFVDGNTRVEWSDDSPVSAKTEAEIKTASDEYDAHLVAIAYKSARAEAYPPIGDQLDALWKGGDDQAAMKVIVDKVKSDNPKPE
jgi:hypothetical protein